MQKMGVQSIRTGGTYVKIDKNENGTGDGYLWKRVRKTPGWHRSWANFSLYRCVPTGVHGPTCIFWASLMPLSLPDARAALAPAAGATARRRGAAPVGRLPPLPRLGAIRGRHHGPHGAIRTPLRIFYTENHERTTRNSVGVALRQNTECCERGPFRPPFTYSRTEPEYKV